MAFDFTRMKIVMFGGLDFPAVLGDMWEWDGEDWRQITGVTMPPARAFAAIGSDPVRGRVLLYGGAGASSIPGIHLPLWDTWEWDGSHWAQRSFNTYPRGVLHCTMAFNPVTGRLALLGGANNGCVSGDVVNEWDGNDWVPIQATGAVPRCFAGNGMTDPLFRGVLAQQDGEMWLFDGATWTAMPSLPLPVTRSLATLDLARQQVVGLHWQENPLMQRTLLFDAALGSWRSQSVLLGDPDVRSSYDFVRRRVVFGPEWTWSQGGWEALPATQGPAVAADGLLAQHPGTGKIVYLSDAELASGRTWVHDGTDWHASSFTVGPPASSGGTFAADPVGDRLLLWHGGAMWEWKPVGGWRLLGSWSGPAIEGLAFDASRNRMVGVSGLSATPPVFDTWEWTGQTWVRVPTANAPPADVAGHGVYAPAFGGVLTIRHDPNPANGLLVHRYDGQDWSRLTVRGSAPPYDTAPFSSPPRSVTYDASRRRVLVGYDAIYSSWSDPLYELVIEELSADREILQPGQTVTFRTNFPSEARKPWLLLLSESNEVGVVARPSPLVGAEVLPLDMDPLLLASLASWMGGVLNHQGQGSFALPIPNSPALRGLSFHGGAVVIGPGLSIDAVSNGVPVQVAW